MSKRRGKSLSERQASSLLKKVQLIRTNFKQNQKFIQEQYKELFKKSLHFERTIYKEDEDIFDVRYERAMTGASRIRTNKKVQKEIKNFIARYSEVGLGGKRRAVSRLAMNSRDEYINHFKGLQMDNDVIKYLQEQGLYNNPNFWRSFFNSSYFVPLYLDYKAPDSSDFATTWRKEHNTNHSFWGDNLLTYSLVYQDKENDSSSPNHIKFKYENDKKD